jgi:hypothetical protein
MDDEDRMPPLSDRSAMMWHISEDRLTARAHLPPLQIADASRPLSIYFDMDAEAVDSLMQRLAEVRAQMLPALKQN